MIVEVSIRTVRLIVGRREAEQEMAVLAVAEMFVVVVVAVFVVVLDEVAEVVVVIVGEVVVPEGVVVGVVVFELLVGGVAVVVSGTTIR